MAAYYDAGADQLLVTLTTGMDRTKYNVLHCHAKWETGKSHNSTNYVMQVEADTGLFKSMHLDTTPDLTVRVNTANVSGSTTLSDNTWHGLGGWWEPDDANPSRRPYVNGVADAASNNTGDLSTNTSNWNKLYIGQQEGSTSIYSAWKGWIAEVSLWEVDTEANAAALIAELATTKANAVTGTGATLRFYAPLITDATVTTGDALTNNGVTFDAEDPGLSGGSPPTSSSIIYPSWF